MIEEIEALGVTLTINFNPAGKLWTFEVISDGHFERTIGQTFRDAFDAMKLRLRKHHESS